MEIISNKFVLGRAYYLIKEKCYNIIINLNTLYILYSNLQKFIYYKFY